MRDEAFRTLVCRHIVVALVLIGVLAFLLSPWPSVFLISRAFSGGDASSEAALSKHVPSGIVSRRDLAYGKRADERFDLNVPEHAAGPLPMIV